MEATEALGMAELAERIVASADNRSDIPRNIPGEPVSTIGFVYFDGKVDSFRARLSTYHWLQANFEPDGEFQETLDNLLRGDYSNLRNVVHRMSTAKDAELVRTVDNADWNLEHDVFVWQIFTDNAEYPSHLVIRLLGAEGYTAPYALKIIGDPGVWLASAKVSHLQAGDHRWPVENGYGFSFQAEGVDNNEFFLTPVIDEDSLGDEQDAYELRIEKQLAALAETTLNPQQIEKARAHIEEARQEARNLRILELMGDASLVLIRRGQKLVAVVDGFDHEITAGNDWL